jgi:membrane protein involved in colicin uptake
MIMRAAGGQNKSHQKKLIEEAKKRAETKARLAAKRKAAEEARRKAEEEARRKAEYEKMGWWERRWEDGKIAVSTVYKKSGQEAIHNAQLEVAEWAWNNTLGNRIK